MTTTGKVVIVGSTVTLAAAAAYYFLVLRKTQASAATAVQNIQKGITVANNATGRQLTISELRAKQWKNVAGVIIPPNYIQAYNPSTGLVNHIEPAWTGILLDANTISWTNRNGQTDTWKCVSNCVPVNGFGRLLR